MQEAIYKMKGIDLNSLGTTWPLEKWFYEMVQKSVSELTLGDVSRMLRQDIFLDIAVPLAWDLLLENPFAGEMFDGQLVENLTQVFIKRPELKESGLYEKFVESYNEKQAAHEWWYEGEKEEVEAVVVEFMRLFE